jgi:hypothetical protein
MKKTGKRMLAVLLLILTVLLVGCLVFTGNRLASYPQDIEEYKRATFIGKDGTMVAFTENGAWYGVGENEVIFLEITGNEEGVITMMKNNEKYRFVAIDEQTIYAEKTKEFLTRRVSIDDDFT